MRRCILIPTVRPGCKNLGGGRSDSLPASKQRGLAVRWSLRVGGGRWRQKGMERSKDSSPRVARDSESPPSSHTRGCDSRPEPGWQGARTVKRNRREGAPSARARRAQRKAASAQPMERAPPAGLSARPLGRWGPECLSPAGWAPAGCQELGAPLHLLRLLRKVLETAPSPAAYICPPVPSGPKPLGGCRPRPLPLHPFPLPSLQPPGKQRGFLESGLLAAAAVVGEKESNL